MSYIPNTPEQQQEMARVLGLSSPEELFRDIPEGVRLKRSLALPPAMSEMQLRAHLEALAARNTHSNGNPLFLGGGVAGLIVVLVIVEVAYRIGAAAISLSLLRRHVGFRLFGSIAVLGEPVGASLLAMLILRETPVLTEILGGASILFGIFLVLYFSPETVPPKEEIASGG